ncbi:MAG: hypothetical protein J6S44_04270, partial [Clostridia bacterium]|nr:hypothetical protein [Clostridia bacterium]
MRIKKGDSVLLPSAATHRFLMVVDCLDGVVAVEKDGETRIRLSVDENEGVLAELVFSDGRRARLHGDNAKGKEIILTQGNAHVVLYVNGVLADEDFFYAPIVYEGATLTAGSFSHFEAGYLYHSMWESAVVENAFSSLSTARPLGNGNEITKAFSCDLPDGQHIYYFVKSEGDEKCGKGAVRLFALLVRPSGEVDSLPIALPIDEIAEDGVLDATLLWHEGRGYLYYLMEKETGTQFSCAVSEDGYSFIKTGLDVEIPTVDNRSVTALSVEDRPAPRLYF